MTDHELKKLANKKLQNQEDARKKSLIREWEGAVVFDNFYRRLVELWRKATAQAEAFENRANRRRVDQETVEPVSEDRGTSILEKVLSLVTFPAEFIAVASELIVAQLNRDLDQLQAQGTPVTQQDRQEAQRVAQDLTENYFVERLPAILQPRPAVTAVAPAQTARPQYVPRPQPQVVEPRRDEKVNSSSLLLDADFLYNEIHQYTQNHINLLKPQFSSALIETTVGLSLENSLIGLTKLILAEMNNPRIMHDRYANSSVNLWAEALRKGQLGLSSQDQDLDQIIGFNNKF